MARWLPECARCLVYDRSEVSVMYEIPCRPRDYCSCTGEPCVESRLCVLNEGRGLETRYCFFEFEFMDGERWRSVPQDAELVLSWEPLVCDRRADLNASVSD
ncbi:hypothetical protein LX36DRAFT_443355 [Colletotrichum falcatum]|nr:hypothetical protein LX36DRAFT_443355 [Colletotrichum falcatum]